MLIRSILLSMIWRNHFVGHRHIAIGLKHCVLSAV
jgi:hypothetical protein